MELIAAFKRFFDPGLSRAETRGPHIADLLQQDKAALESAIMGASYELSEEERGQCRVVTDKLTVTFGWWWREQWIVADIGLHNSPDPLFEMYLEHPARDWLEALRFPTLPQRAGGSSQDLLRDELELVRQAVAQILSNERKTRDALCYLTGLALGYNDRVLDPDEAPPAVVTRWTEERLRLGGLRRGRR